jgi:hypothetical protein
MNSLRSVVHVVPPRNDVREVFVFFVHAGLSERTMRFEFARRRTSGSLSGDPEGTEFRSSSHVIASDSVTIPNLQGCSISRGLSKSFLLAMMRGLDNTKQ